MNVLIVDPSVVPDISYQQCIVQHFGRAADISVRLATGILQATWQIRDFNPDVIVFDRIGNCEQLTKLIAMLRRTNPGVAMFRLDGQSLVATENPCGSPATLAVPHWLQEMATHWILARSAPLPRRGDHARPRQCSAQF
jgi:hypothetical protein